MYYLREGVLTVARTTGNALATVMPANINGPDARPFVQGEHGLLRGRARLRIADNDAAAAAQRPKQEVRLQNALRDRRRRTGDSGAHPLPNASPTNPDRSQAP